jgi:putative hydrolase of the HAD superfamily
MSQLTMSERQQPRLVVAFDADDTLWHNEGCYQQVLQQFRSLLQDRNESTQVEQALAEAEVRNIDWYGYGIKSDTLSMIEAAVALAGERVTGQLIESILQLGREMLSADVVLFEHVEEVLAQLARHHDLMLITKGDLLEQNNKVKRSGLGRHFKWIEIVQEKTSETYRGLLAKHGVSADRFLMVGNSLKSDVLPVLQIGGRAVFVPYEHTWAHERADAGGHNYYEIEHLDQLRELIDRLTASA